MIPITSQKDLGRVLRHFRKQLGLSQAQVGEKLNIRQATISSIESGSVNVGLETLFRLLSALGLEMHLENRRKAAMKAEDNGMLW